MQDFPKLAVAVNIELKEKPRASTTETQTDEINIPSAKKNKKKKKKKKQKYTQPEVCDIYEYEVEGAPWWMPVDNTIFDQYKSEKTGNIETHSSKNNKKKKNNTSVINKKETVVDDYAQDIYDMDSVKIVVNDNPWLQQQITDKEDKRQYVLSIDFQINCRKFILFTSLLLFIVVMTFLSSAYTGFYEFRGYTFNFIVITILMYGIFVGFVCSEMNRYKTRTVLVLLNVYWSIAWIIIVVLGVTALIYLVLFPNKFVNYCSTRRICDATLGSIIFAEMSLLCTLILYIFLMFFYMERIAKLVILISNIKDYEFKYEDNCFMRLCHKHIYRYLRGWKSFKTIIGKHTGLRISDVLYCSCWFRKCRRNSSNVWQASHSKTKKNKHKSKYKDSSDSTGSENSQKISKNETNPEDFKKKKKKKKASNNYDTYHTYDDYDYYDGTDMVFDTMDSIEPPYAREKCCWDWCDNINYNDKDIAHCWCLRDCHIACDWRDVCSGCSECVQDINICNKDNCTCCGCCGTYHTDNTDDCLICCKSIMNIFCCGDCGCDDCGDCGEAAPYVCIGIIVAGICIVTFLLPIIVFGCIAAPFWLLAQYFVWKLNDKVSWIFVIIIFVIFLIPPCVIWVYIWSAICLGNLTNTFMDIMCLIWSFFHTIYSSLS